MTPCSSFYNIQNHTLANTILPGQPTLTDITDRVSSEDLRYLDIRKDSVTTTFPAWPSFRALTTWMVIANWITLGMHTSTITISLGDTLRMSLAAMARASGYAFRMGSSTVLLACRLPILRYHIRYIISVGTKKQMCAILTARHVTFMQDVISSRVITMLQVIRDTISPLTDCLNRKARVAAVELCSVNPKPAFIGSCDNDLTPESFNVSLGKRWKWSILSGHVAYTSIISYVIEAGALTRSRLHLFYRILNANATWGILWL